MIMFDLIGLMMRSLLLLFSVPEWKQGKTTKHACTHGGPIQISVSCGVEFGTHASVAVEKVMDFARINETCIVNERTM